MGNKKYHIGLYEKAMPSALNWEEKLQCARDCGYDFVEISIDETDARLARLEWTAEERAQLRETMQKVGVPIRSMCLSGHRKYPFGASDPPCASAAWRSWKKPSSWPTTWAKSPQS